MFHYKKASMKGLILVLILILLISGFQATGLTVGIDDSSPLKITYAEIKAMENAMNVRGIGGKIIVEILYDFRGEPTFLLGVSDSGYQIIERNNLMCIEGGEYNPYNGFSNNIKYYCGFLNYYVYTGDNYIDVRSNLKIECLPRYDYLSEDAMVFMQIGLSRQVLLLQHLSHIQKLSRIMNQEFSAEHSDIIMIILARLLLVL